MVRCLKVRMTFKRLAFILLVYWFAHGFLTGEPYFIQRPFKNILSAGKSTTRIVDILAIANKTISAKSMCIHQVQNAFYNSIDPITNPPVFQLKDDSTIYFTNDARHCFIEGIDTDALNTADSSFCKCKPSWHGQNCSVPEAFIQADLPPTYTITQRSKPRRLIYAFPFNIEFEMVEAMLSELGDVVDVFIVSESNYSAHGDPKPLRLLDRLKKGFCSNIQQKIVYVFTGFFPKEAYKSGWIADDLPRDQLGLRGLRNQIKGVRHDDIFILTDADELPTRDTLLFIKHHDGFPEPFGFHLHRTTYGFYWLSANGDWPISAGVTVGMLNHVWAGKASKIRNPEGHFAEVMQNLNTYISSGGLVHLWKFGNRKYKTGWHCSWCFGIPEMKIKLTSAMNGDFPRWGDYIEKQNETYLKGLVQKGLWFNGQPVAVNPSRALVNADYNLFAPRHILSNHHRYMFLLKNPFL